jgi:hypothetical protein
MPTKTKDQSLSAIFNSIPTPEVKKKAPLRGLEKQPPSRFSTIQKAQCGVDSISKETSKYIGKIGNSIFEPDKLEKMSKTQSNDEKTREEKAKVAQVRKNWKDEATNKLMKELESVDTRKDAAVYRLSETSEGKGFIGKTGLGMFDMDKFEKLPEKTSGEKLYEENMQRRNKKDYIPELNKSRKLGSTCDSIFNAIMNAKEEK